jgi:hypothetical protein
VQGGGDGDGRSRPGLNANWPLCCDHSDRDLA